MKFSLIMIIWWLVVHRAALVQRWRLIKRTERKKEPEALSILKHIVNGLNNCGNENCASRPQTR